MIAAALVAAFTILAEADACRKSSPNRRTNRKTRKLPVPGPKNPSYRPMTPAVPRRASAPLRPRRAWTVVATEVLVQQRVDAARTLSSSGTSARNRSGETPVAIHAPTSAATNAPAAAGSTQAPVEPHVPDEARDRARGAGETRELAGAEQGRVRRLRKRRKQRRQLDQAAAAGQRVDEAGAERGDEHEAGFRASRRVCEGCGQRAGVSRAASPRA